MRILFALPYVPSLVRGRSFNFIKYVAQRHAVSVLALQQDSREAADLPLLRRYCESIETVHLSRTRSLLNCATALPSRTPLQGVYSFSSAFGHRLRTMLDQSHFDVVHVEHLRGAYLARWLGNTPAVLDAVDCISLLWERLLESNRSLAARLLARVELPRTRRYEASLGSMFDRVLVTSPHDRLALGRLLAAGGAERISIVPSGVHLAPPPGVSERDPSGLVFSGKLSYHANGEAVRYFCREILPVIRRARPDVTLTLVGSNPPPEMRRLATGGHVVVTGAVPDVRPYLRRAAVAVAPMRYAVGIQNKVLEAMAMSTPVVATAVACSALEVRRGDDCLVADDPLPFAQHVLRLLQDSVLRDHVGANGRRYVEANHEWSNVADRLIRIYEEVAAGQGKEGGRALAERGDGDGKEREPVIT